MTSADGRSDDAEASTAAILDIAARDDDLGVPLTRRDMPVKVRRNVFNNKHTRTLYTASFKFIRVESGAESYYY